MVSLTYLSHSSWQITTENHSIVIDPFIEGNPNAPVQVGDIKADYIIVTHAHGDHLGSSLQIAENCGSTIIANFEIATWCAGQGYKAHSMHIGGSFAFPFGRVKLTPAFHGSSFPDGRYGGMPTGALVFVDGKIIYHTGDTGLFGDMKLIGEMNPIDVALVPIGDNFTMGIEDALKAVELIGPKRVIPMHYNTFDVIAADPVEFVARAEKQGTQGQVLAFGESIDL